MLFIGEKNFHKTLDINIIDMLRQMELKLEYLMKELKSIKANKKMAKVFKYAEHVCMMKKWDEVLRIFRPK